MFMTCIVDNAFMNTKLAGYLTSFDVFLEFSTVIDAFIYFKSRMKYMHINAYQKRKLLNAQFTCL